jgi:hypothetical protein
MKAGEGYVKSQYEDIEKDYKRASRIEQTVPVIRRILWLSFVGASVGLFLISLGYLVWFFVQGNFEDERLQVEILNGIAEERQLTLSTAASPIITGEVIASGSAGERNFLARIENPNDDWLATFQYFFTDGSQSTSPRRGYVLPLAEQAISEFGSNLGSNGSLVIEDIEWVNLSIPNREAYQSSRLRFETLDIVHGNRVEVNEATLTQTSFAIKNNSAYSYWEVPLLVELTRAGRPVAFAEYEVRGLMAGEAREVTLTWTQQVPTNAAVRITPQINVYDPEVYMPNDSGDESLR